MFYIELNHNCYLKVKEKSCTLFKRYEGKTKDGRVKNSEKKIGYYPDISGAINKYMDLVQSEMLEEEQMQLEDYVKRIEQINRDTVHKIAEISKHITNYIYL